MQSQAIYLEGNWCEASGRDKFHNISMLSVKLSRPIQRRKKHVFF